RRHPIADQLGVGELTMSFHSWLQSLRSALAPRRSDRLRGAPRAARLQPRLEVLDDRRNPSLIWGGDFSSSEWAQNATYDSSQVTADFNADGRLDFFQVQGGWADSDWMVEPVWITTESVLLGQADGTAKVWESWTLSWEPDFIGTGDFNGDGRPDVVTN